MSPATSYDTISAISWQLDGSEVQTEDTLNLVLSTPGVYELSVIINSETLITSTSKLFVFNSPEAEFFYEDTAGNIDYSYIFRAYDQEPDTFDYNFEWRIDSQLEGSSSSLYYSFPSTGEYSVELSIENNHGCVDSIFQLFSVSDYLKCPNVFTPNMDGFNDFFRVKTDGITTYSFQVFARTGLKVFETESPTISWDGRSLSGLEMQPGIYFYTIEPVSGNSKETVSGFVHLIR
jgi:gliding motility-associated-like protein